MRARARTRFRRLRPPHPLRRSWRALRAAPPTLPRGTHTRGRAVPACSTSARTRRSPVRARTHTYTRTRARVRARARARRARHVHGVCACAHVCARVRARRSGGEHASACAHVHTRTRVQPRAHTRTRTRTRTRTDTRTHLLVFRVGCCVGPLPAHVVGRLGEPRRLAIACVSAAPDSV